MEFFEEIEKHGVDVGALKDSLQIASLPEQCRSIDSVISDNHDTGEIYCVWGQFDISRQVIKNGVRFALLDCPHAFAWTITYHQHRNMLVVHCTIDDREEDEDFIESIKEFAANWAFGPGNALPGNT
jgi:hypothetical protein